MEPTDRYMEIWGQLSRHQDCENFAKLTQNKDLDSRQFALITVDLGKVLKTISKEQAKRNWEGGTWHSFKLTIDQLRLLPQTGKNKDINLLKLKVAEALKEETEERWEAMKNRCLTHRIPAFDQSRWGRIKKITFTARLIYHSVIAVIFEYGLRFLRRINFITGAAYNKFRSANVGDRLAILLLERYGIGYNLQKKPLNTVEYRLWNYVTTC